MVDPLVLGELVGLKPVGPSAKNDDGPVHRLLVRCPKRLHVVRRVDLLSLLLAQARNTFRAGGAHSFKYNVQTSVQEISSARAGHYDFGVDVLNP